MHLWVKNGVISNIELAKIYYGATAEDALIALLLAESQTPLFRTHKAIWTLGQIQSEKALQMLYKFYKNEDTPGESCRGHHATQLCQHELYKAITAIEKGRLISFRNLNK